MENLKSKFDSGELNVLYRVFSMLKYGVGDEHQMLNVLSSPIFKKLFDSIYHETIVLVNESLPDKQRMPLLEYIESQNIPFKTLKDNVRKCIEMHKDNPESNWSEWKEDWKKEMVINLASPYLIHDITINEILKNKI